MATQRTLFAEQAWLPTGWADSVSIAINDIGDIAEITTSATFDPAKMEQVAGPLIPGMPNLHSHAHQRAMAGMSEYRASGPGAEDSFWTWREVMHAFARQVTPGVLETVATQLYIEMLKAGYTAVCEFHYMHHQVGGSPFDDPAEMSYALVRAAERSGIGLTLLPVLYSRGGYGGKAPNEGQLRFISAPDTLLDIIRNSMDAGGESKQLTVGVAPHSPRQIVKEALDDVVSGLDQLNPSAPVHIHVAEQENDVTESVEFTGKRPVEWTLDNYNVDGRWCLVHATHLSDVEVARLAASGAIAGICPTTEANLGDGLFPLEDYLAAGGKLGIGSDSHISVDVVEELRWLEYGQRLTRRRRNLAAAGPGGSTGVRLYSEALSGGAQAAGRNIGEIAKGNRADFVVLDVKNPNLVGKSGDRLIDSMIFAGNTPVVRDVWVGGRQVVSEGRHVVEADAYQDYAETMRTLEL